LVFQKYNLIKIKLNYKLIGFSQLSFNYIDRALIILFDKIDM